MSIYQVWIPGEIGYKEHIDRIRVSNENIHAIREQTNQIKNAIRTQNTDSSDQMKRLVASNEQVISALDNGFNRLIEVNQRGFERVTSAVEAMHSDFVYLLGTIVQKLEYQNRILNDILSAIQAPFETKVREFYSKGCSLIDGGILDKAIEYLLQSIALPTGDIFFPSHYQLGRLYLSGVDEGINVINLKLATEYLSLANKWGNGIHKSKSQTTSGLDKTLLENIKSGAKLYAVKLCADTNKWGLQQAKDYVEQLEKLGHSPTNSFSPVLSDCKFYLSQSYWFQLSGQNNSHELNLLNNAIKYCEEAVSLNSNLSQGYYHLAKYYSFRFGKYTDYQNDKEKNKVIEYLLMAVQIDRNYLRTIILSDPLYDSAFTSTMKFIVEAVSSFTNDRRKIVKIKLDKAKGYLNQLESTNIGLSRHYSEFREEQEKYALAERDFQTGTYFGIDDCELKLESL